jgi:3-dehydroquinate synthase
LALADARVDRDGVVVAVGGGALLDAAAFAAATWLRGIDVVLVPTTLTGQVDAGLGGKSAINHATLKNQIGVIRAPSALWVDTGFLAGLPEVEFASGLGEVAKSALLFGGGLWTCVTSESAALLGRSPDVLGRVVESALRAKASVVRDDPFDHGRRMVLNAGHTLGHVLESAAARRGLPMPHGAAVAIGLHLEARVVPGFDTAAVAAATRALGLPEVAPFDVGREEALAALAGDKKRRGASIRVPVIEAPGVVSFHAASPEALAAAFER